MSRRAVGRNVDRKEGAGKVTGAARYLDDLRFPNLLVALGSVAPTVMRLPRTEAALATGASVPDAQRALLEEIAPIDDIRATADYRRRVAANLLAQFLDEHRKLRRSS